MFFSLRSRLILLVILAVIPALALIFYTAAEQRRQATTQAESDVIRLARLAAADQERLINDTRQLLLTLSHLTEIRNQDTIACTRFLGDLLYELPRYSNLGVASKDGRVYCSARVAGLDTNVSGQSFFQLATQERDFAIGDYSHDPITDLPSISYAHVVLSEDGIVDSVVFATLNLNWLNQLISESQLREGTTLIMLDHNGTILAHYPDADLWVGKNLPDSSLISSIIEEGVGITSASGLDGVLRLYAFTPVSTSFDTNLYVGIGISESLVFQQANINTIRQLVGLSIVFFLAIGLAWVGGDIFILSRVKAILAATKLLATGDLKARTGLIYGRGELSQLARAFDQMAESLDVREEARQFAENEIRRQNQNLAAFNTITATISSSLELPEVIESLKSLLVDQLNVPGGALHLYNETEDFLFVEAAWGVPASILAEFKRFPATTLHYELIVRDAKAVLRKDFREVVPFSLLGLDAKRPEWQSYIGVPLIAKGKVHGALDLFSQYPSEFTQDHLALFCNLGQQVGVAIQNARLFDQVRVGRQRLQILSQQLLEIQEAERRHIARELHDEIGQTLTAVKVNLQAAQNFQDGSNQKAYLDESITIVEATLQQVRNLSLELRPSLLDDLGVVAALRWYIDRQAQRAGFKAQFITHLPETRLHPEVETTCFRIVQEALTNVVRHAKARYVSVELYQRDNQLELAIWDDGVGFDVEAAMERAAGDLSLGLLGMKERAQLIGGRISIHSDTDKGTTIRAYFPLDMESHYETI